MTEVLFELWYPDGTKTIAYADGSVDGAPPGTTVVNRWPIFLRAALKQQASQHLEAGNLALRMSEGASPLEPQPPA